MTFETLTLKSKTKKGRKVYTDLKQFFTGDKDGSNKIKI